MPQNSCSNFCWKFWRKGAGSKQVTGGMFGVHIQSCWNEAPNFHTLPSDELQKNASLGQGRPSSLLLHWSRRSRLESEHCNAVCWKFREHSHQSSKNTLFLTEWQLRVWAMMHEIFSTKESIISNCWIICIPQNSASKWIMEMHSTLPVKKNAWPSSSMELWQCFSWASLHYPMKGWSPAES